MVDEAIWKCHSTQGAGVLQLSPEQGTNVVEGIFGQLKGCWRILLRKNECYSETLKLMSLACIILHNLCIDLEDKGLRAWNLAFDETQKRRPRDVVRDLLHMASCRTFSGSSQKARQVRDHLRNKFWDEKLQMDS